MVRQYMRVVRRESHGRFRSEVLQGSDELQLPSLSTLVYQGGGCYASLGRQGTPTQDVSIGQDCDQVRGGTDGRTDREAY